MAEVEFFGETFGMNAVEEYQWEMLEFAQSAKGGADSDLLSGAAAVFDFLKAVIVAEDWDRFREVARKNRAQIQRDLMPVVVKAWTQSTERPTSLPSDSSGGQTSTEPSSEAGSSLRVVKRLEEQGRPDLALVVQLADEGRSARSA